MTSEIYANKPFLLVLSPIRPTMCISVNRNDANIEIIKSNGYNRIFKSFEKTSLEFFRIESITCPNNQAPNNVITISFGVLKGSKNLVLK